MSIRKKYQQLFFDLDHTLWDFETNARETLDDLFIHYNLLGKGIPSFEDFHRIYSHHNDILWERFRKGYIKRDELRWKRMWLTLLDFKIGDQQLAREMGMEFLEILPTKTHLFPHTMELMEDLKAKNYPLHLITNGFEQTQMRKLHHCGILPYFTHIITSESAGSLKPHPEIFEFALHQAGVGASSALMIGDALEVDILGAQKAGMDQVYFTPVPNHRKDIIPTFTIHSLQELMAIL
ncbi:MAG: YjjG family noncanonical pyrimidine nucleotidase [Chitinophagaceae bacterium]